MDLAKVLEDECSRFEVFRSEESALTVSRMGRSGDRCDFDEIAGSFGSV